MSWVGPGTFIEHRQGMNFIALGQTLTHLLGLSTLTMCTGGKYL